MEKDTLLKVIIGLSIVGVAVAAYQTYEHYFLASSFCDLSATFSCSAVTESRFGDFPPNSGIATAAWGIVWWLGLIALSYGSFKKREWFKNQDFYIFSYIVAGLGFVAYLLVVELYILPKELGTTVICPFCTVQHAIIVLLVFVSYPLLDKSLGAYMADIFYTEDSTGGVPASEPGTPVSGSGEKEDPDMGGDEGSEDERSEEVGDRDG